MAELADLLKIAQRAPQSALLVDEAYFEFYGETLLRQWHSFPTDSFRTFSNAYGLAGLLIGVLAGHAGPITIGTPRQFTPRRQRRGTRLLANGIGRPGLYPRVVDQVRQARKLLQPTVPCVGSPHWPSEANFVMGRFGPRKSAFIRAMQRRGILVRDRSTDYGRAGCVRITLGTAEQTERLLTALRTTLKEIGVNKARAK